MTENVHTPKWPIVYHSRYNVSFFGLEKLHPFDASKWRSVIKVWIQHVSRLKSSFRVLILLGFFQYLKQGELITDESIHTPEEIKKRELLMIHTRKYLNSLNVCIIYLLVYVFCRTFSLMTINFSGVSE